MKDLARLSLQDPMFVSVHENATESTPDQLEQVSYLLLYLFYNLNNRCGQKEPNCAYISKPIVTAILEMEDFVCRWNVD